MYKPLDVLLLRHCVTQSPVQTFWNLGHASLEVFWCGTYSKGQSPEAETTKRSDECSQEHRILREWDLPKPRLGIELCEDLGVLQLTKCGFNTGEDVEFSADVLIQFGEVHANSHFPISLWHHYHPCAPGCRLLDS